MTREPGGTPLRRRVLVAMVGVASLAVALFAVPLALSLGTLYRDETAVSLGRDAAWIAANVPDEPLGNSSMALPAGVPHGLTVGVYSSEGKLLFGHGPASSKVVRNSVDGRPHEAVEDGYLAVSAPVPTDERVKGVVRVATPYDMIERRVHKSWMLMGGLAIIVVGLAAAFALSQAARLARPLERLTRAAEALGAGDFSIRAPHSGVREADVAGQALAATARRLGDVLARERAFSVDVSHQLRTRLTATLLGLESALTRPDADLRAAIETALGRGEQLRSTVEDLVRLTRDGGHGDAAPLDVVALLNDIRDDRHGEAVTVNVPIGLPHVAASAAAVRQVLQVLLDNATEHGAGEITVDAADLGDAVAIEVSDRGTGIPEGVDPFVRRPDAREGHGIGLALARSLAEAEGGRLVLRESSPPVFSLLLPVSQARSGSRGHAAS